MLHLRLHLVYQLLQHLMAICLPGGAATLQIHEYIYVDLRARYDLCEVILKWETALGQDFKIQVSDDAANWTTIKTITGNKSFENYIPLQGSGRYVRMHG